MKKSNIRNVAIIDNDPNFCSYVEYELKKLSYPVTIISDFAKAEYELKTCIPSIILLDWKLGELDGLTLIKDLKKDYPMACILFTTAHATPEIAAKSIQLGAFDFLTKPLDLSRFALTIQRAQEHFELLQRIEEAQATTTYEMQIDGIIANSPQMKTVFNTILNVSQTDASVMIFGESGVGKELVANSLHAHSARSNNKLISLNMSTVPDDLVESQLFGHKQGAFTGADKDQPGAIHEADGGTLFFDEITEMPIHLQAKLLRFLQENTFYSLGSTIEEKANVRFISAMNRDPLKSIENNNLREDLYYRLNVIPIFVPPLREREGDITLLAIYFLRKYSQEYQKNFFDFEPSAIKMLEEYSWPGNVRELSNVIQRITILHNGNSVKLEHVQDNIKQSEISSADLVDANLNTPSYEKSKSSENKTNILLHFDKLVPLSELEKLAIIHALDTYNGVIVEAAEALGISRATIYRKMKIYNIDPYEGVSK